MSETKPQSKPASSATNAARYGHMPVSSAKPLPWVKALPRADFAELFRGTATRLGAKAAEIELALLQMEVD